MIAFTRLPFSGGATQIYVVNVDGTGLRRLTNGPGTDYQPAWSPDGTKLAFASNRDGNFEIYVINADGTGLRRLTNDPGSDFPSAWSPDGAKILFTATSGISVMNADGTGRRTLLPGTTAGWSPDGSKIVFAAQVDGILNIFVANADGTGQRNLTSSTLYELYPDWSPDGRKIVFSRAAGNSAPSDVWVMNADGSGQTRLTDSPGSDRRAVWSPDGNSIAFDSDRARPYSFEDIYTMAADGSAVRRITNLCCIAGGIIPAWQRIPRAVDLSVTQRAAPKVLRVGKRGTLTISVRNRSAAAATGVVLSAAIPKNLRVLQVRASGATCTRGARVTCKWPQLAGTAAVAISVRGTKAGSAVIAASVKSLDADPSSANNASRLTVKVKR